MAERGELTHLMDEAVAATERLSSEASSAHQQIDTWMARAKVLSDRIEHVGEESHTALQDGAGRLEKLDQELAHEADEAKSAFEALTQKARELETQATELLTRVHAGVEHLHGVREQIFNRIQEESEHHKQELGTLAASVEQFEHKVEGHWSEAHDEIKGFVGQLDEHLDDIKGHHDQFLADVEHFREDHNNLLQDHVEHLQQFGQHSGDLLGNLVSHVEGLTDEHASGLAQTFGSEVVQQLVSSCEPLSGAFDLLHEMAGGSHQTVLGKFEEITGHMGEVTGIIDKVKPALDMIEEML